ncbi:arylsulfatase [Terricaulis silvestris]|uniref:Arylsulfatase n=1 Tax=Terricaulis silvestris TaxID=2686094 RepID=A0A6I6MLQ9_9CAUL|nr:arylsulfatase [Terricaulis silvestris]QGZ96160.1 Arylsulfatase [Terricaulis silvestris]
MPKRRSHSGISRRTALTGALTLGGAGAASCAAGVAQEQTFQGRIGATFDESAPNFARERDAPAGAPNVVVIVLDDVGFSDLGCYGGEIATPAMDALASGGLRYTSFRTTGVCSSTRASLLTGLNPHSAGLGWLTFADEGYPGYRGDLAADAITLAETLSAHGYLAYHCGKWHVNAEASATAVGPFENWPLQRGYQRAHWFQGHSLHYYQPSNVYDGNQRVEISDQSYFATDAFTDNAIRYLREHAAVADGRPFLLSLAHAAAHSPLHATPEDIAAQRGRYELGWDHAREARLARQIELGVVPPNTRLPPRNRGVAAWSELSPDQRRLYSRYMELYAAVVARLDANIGRLIAALSETGALDNTMIMLISDNGGSPDGALTGTPNLLASGVGGVPLAEVLPLIDELGGPGTYPMYPMGWAMASNTPFRSYKHDTHLGGVADPLIVHWPRGIAARGEVRPQYAHVSDVLPTILACSGVRPLEARNGRAAKSIQGIDFSPTFARAEAPETRTAQHFELNGTRAMYAEGWRLVSKAPFRQEGDGWELYNLAEACNELEDVAAAHPEKVAELEQRWIQAAHRYDVFPIDTRTIKEKSWGPFFRGGERSRWVLTPPIDLIPEEAAPALVGRSHTIEIVLQAPLRAGQDGVLLASGNVFLGCVLYLQGGKLVHEFSCLPRSLRTEAPAPVGASRIVLRHEVTSRPWQGLVELFADDRSLIRQHHEPLLFGRAMQGLQIGRNGSTPTSKAYERPFEFRGAIRSVIIDLDNSPYTPEEIASALRPPRRV